MKQNLKIGQMVDDGTGDYLRAGGKKINDNFDELYYQLGDGDIPHSAGAWKTHKTSDGNTVDAVFGKSYTLDTTDGRINFKLPKGSIEDYNKVIRIRDVFSTWQRQPVTLIPATGDTIKGSGAAVEINRNFADLELVYCSPGRWEYIDNKQIDKISNNDLATVVRQDFIATEGQIDFMDVFSGYDYNTVSLQVYHRGNLLFYTAKGKDFDKTTAEFGSPVQGDPTDIKALDGRNIRLKMSCKAGDTVSVVSFMDGISQWRSSYNRREIRLLDSSLTTRKTINGSIVVDDLSIREGVSMTELGIDASSPVNPQSLQVFLNSTLLYEAGTAGLPTFRCEGFDEVESAEICSEIGGAWTESATDYLFTTIDEEGDIPGIKFDRKFEHNDVLSIVWYNNDIGTTLELDEILDATDERYVATGAALNITGRVNITDYDNPGWPNVEPAQASEIKPSAVASIFDLVYPIGTIYENAVNPNNPVTYMGFGTWKRWGEGKFLAGWSSDAGDSKFGLNNNDIDISGNPSHTAGGTGGHDSVYIRENNIPKIKTDEKVLITDDNGPIVIGGCQFDPDDEGPAYTKYREDYATINKQNDPNAVPLDTLPPYITVYRWLRIS
ncbi:baseplate wedge subunit [Serratia phage CHI14]|uniref:Baseplate wedge protein gp10 n=2 Tax=Winklervirus chi14 TaxID=2560752 RepID=A0A1Z1LYF8_9CAUD|nr:baseplate wedge subunit [Serratia phage CHI14]ARW57585.1 baseplate wedge subunit and tail pin [Serratia phage CHI14]ARW57860.1 baseplate wedge subunit and tail pin [Serratia phage CBH8]